MKTLVIGPRGVGEIYLRNLINHQIDVYSTNYKKNKDLLKKYNINILKKLDNKKKYNLVIICSKTNTHAKYIKKFENRCNKIIVEKPLAWFPLIKNNIEFFNSINHNKIVTNLPMISIAKDLKKYINGKIKTIVFDYSTGGKNFYKNIAIDLLPHAISFIFQLLKKYKLNLISYKINKTSNVFNFHINNVLYKIIISQKFNKKSNLKITINNNVFNRVQKKVNDKFMVFLKNEDKMISIKNPMDYMITKNIKSFNKNISYNTQKSLIEIMSKIKND